MAISQDPFYIHHTTSKGNEIAIELQWQFQPDGVWKLKVSPLIDNWPGEYRGRTKIIDGVLYHLVHRPFVDAYAIPAEKWVVPACPVSTEWKTVLSAIGVTSYPGALSVDVSLAIQSLLSSDTEEGRMLRVRLDDIRHPSKRRTVHDLVYSPMGRCIAAILRAQQPAVRITDITKVRRIGVVV